MKKNAIALILLFIVSILSAQHKPLEFSLEEETGEKKSFATGLEFNDDGYENTQMKIQTRGIIPEAASLKQFTPTPKNQGNYGTCVAWSTTYCARTIIEASQNNWNDKATIDANAFSPYFIYELAKKPGDNGCRQGTDIESALAKLKEIGTAKMKTFDYECPGGITREAKEQADKYRIVDYAKIFSLGASSKSKIEATKNSIAQGKPVVIGMNCPPSFENAKLYWMRLPDESPRTIYYRHAMCVVGYDDNKYCGAFEVMNSWGTDWGNDGYIWIKYDDFAEFTRYGYELIEQIPESSETADMSGEIEFKLRNGGSMEADKKENSFKMKKAYSSGTQFKMLITNKQPAFVYIIGSDLTNEPYVIFPMNRKMSAALNYQNNKVAIPKRGWAAMNDVVGTDYFCVFYAKKPLDIYKIQKRIKQTAGTFETKVKTALDNEVVDFRTIQFDTKQGVITFEGKSEGKNVMAIIFEIEHVK